MSRMISIVQVALTVKAGHYERGEDCRQRPIAKMALCAAMQAGGQKASVPAGQLRIGCCLSELLRDPSYFVVGSWHMLAFTAAQRDDQFDGLIGSP